MAGFCCLIAFITRTIMETPRWLYAHNKYTQARINVRKMAGWSNMEIDEKTFDDFEQQMVSLVAVKFYTKIARYSFFLVSIENYSRITALSKQIWLFLFPWLKILLNSERSRCSSCAHGQRCWHSWSVPCATNSWDDPDYYDQSIRAWYYQLWFFVQYWTTGRKHLLQQYC